MSKYVATLVLFLAVSPPAFSQISLKKESMVPNREPGYCAWVCLETLGRHHKIASLYDLVDKRQEEFTWTWDGQRWWKSPYLWVDYGEYQVMERRNTGSHQAMINKLDSLKIKFTHQDYNNFDKTLIKDAVKNKKGCVVVVKHWENAENDDTSHAIVILDYNKNGIIFYDPNDSTSIYEASHKWFNYYWLGYTLVLEK